MLGFALAAVSPAVVVSCLLSLQDRGYGVVKVNVKISGIVWKTFRHSQGIPSLVIAAASMDDVLAISCFTIILGITFSAGDTGLVMLLLHAPLEILVAVVFGLAWGILVTHLPPQPNPSSGLRSASHLLSRFLI